MNHNYLMIQYNSKIFQALQQPSIFKHRPCIRARLASSSSGVMDKSLALQLAKRCLPHFESKGVARVCKSGIGLGMTGVKPNLKVDNPTTDLD